MKEKEPLRLPPVRLDLFDGKSAEQDSEGAWTGARTKTQPPQSGGGFCPSRREGNRAPWPVRSLATLEARLDLFDGGAGAGGDGAGASPGPQGGQAAEAGGRDGKQAPAGAQEQEGQSGPDSPEERRKRWRELTQGEFRDLYDEEARRLTSRSSREVQDLRERMGRSQPILNMLMERYRIGDGDLGKLLSAVENDNDAWARAAEEAGMSVEQYRQFQRMKRENAELLRQQRDRVGRERADRQLRAWDQQAEQARAVYPGLNLGTEARNPQFLSMLRAGVPVQTAYEVVHMDEIKAGVATAQAQATEKAVTDNIRAKGARPQENGAGTGAGFTVKDDVSRLTPKDRAELARRAARGETITF